MALRSIFSFRLSTFTFASTLNWIDASRGGTWNANSDSLPSNSSNFSIVFVVGTPSRSVEVITSRTSSSDFTEIGVPLIDRLGRISTRPSRRLSSSSRSA